LVSYFIKYQENITNYTYEINFETKDLNYANVINTQKNAAIIQIGKSARKSLLVSQIE